MFRQLMQPRNGWEGAPFILAQGSFLWPRLPRRGGVAKGLATPKLARQPLAAVHTKDSDDPHRPGQPPRPLDTRSRRKFLCLLLAAQGSGAAWRHLAPALFDEGAAGEFAAVRGRQDGHARRSPGDGRLAERTADFA